MSNALRLTEYLGRIGVDGPVKTDLATLASIQAAHVDAIPFECLDPFLGRSVKLDLASLQEKLVDSRRGGYCFEQNTLFKAALETIGFQVTGLGGRVRWMSPPDSPLGPRTHMILNVALPEGNYLADVGFGASLIDRPLPFETNVEHRTAMGTFRLTEAEGMFTLSAKQPGGWRTAYMFNLEPQLASDYELSNWFTSTNPRAPFTSTLIMERLAADRRYKLINDRFTVEKRDGEVAEQRVLSGADELGQILDETFRVTPPVAAAEIFARFGG